MDAIEQRLVAATERLSTELTRLMTMRPGTPTRDRDALLSGVIRTEASNELGMVILISCVVSQEACEGRERPTVQWKMGWRGDDGGIAPIQVEGHFPL